MGRFSLAFKQNFRDGFTKTSLIDDVSSVLAAVGYYGIPALTGQQGYSAMLTAVGAMYLAGKAFNVPALGHGALAIAAFHLMYDNQEKIVQYTNKPMWALNPQKVAAVQTALQQASTQAQDALNQAQSQLPPQTISGLGNAVVDSFNGREVLTYPGGSELPQLNGFSRFSTTDTAEVYGATIADGSIYSGSSSLWN